MIVTKHSSDNVQRILAKSGNSFVILAEQRFSVETEEYSQENIFVVDDLDHLSHMTLRLIFESYKSGLLMFINSTYDKKRFNTLIVNKLLSYYDTYGCFYNAIVYFDNNFPCKSFYTKTSDVLKVTNSTFSVSDKGLIYIGQYGTCGYASAAKGYIADYVLKGVNISWKPLKFDNSKNDNNYYVDVLAESVVDKKLDNVDLTIVHSTPDIWDRYIKDDGRYVGYCTWETNKLPTNWVNKINLTPEVWVPSYFNKECFINSGVKSDIKVVPHVWHPQPRFNKDDITIKDCFGKIIPSNKYTFYSIGELNFRKGIEDLVKVFDKLNDSYPDTQLVLKLHYRTYDDTSLVYCIDTIRKLTGKLSENIFLILNNLTNREILSLHSFCDCYVSLNKGEGFGLTIFDAYHHGNMVVTTGYSAPVEFLGKDYKGLVNYKLNKVSGMESFSTNYSSDQEWAYPDLDHAYELMRKCYEDKL